MPGVWTKVWHLLGRHKRGHQNAGTKSVGPEKLDRMRQEASADDAGMDVRT